MSLRHKKLSIGVLRGGIYTFERAGDVLRWHGHDSRTAHITIVARGRLRMDAGPGGGEIAESRDLSAGSCIDTGAGLHHAFTALEDDSRIYNIIKEPEL